MLVVNSDGGFILIESGGFPCAGAPGSATVSHGFLNIRGVCRSDSPLLPGGQVSGWGMVNGVVMLTVSYQGKPTTSITFVMTSGCPLGWNWCLL
jgi:hypothetical protein